MKHTHTVAVIGGTGKSGKYLVKELLEMGFRIRMLVRNLERLTLQHSAIDIVHGDVNDPGAVTQLLEGCESVISTLGLGVPTSAFDIFSLASTHVVRAMKVHAVDRYIITTGLNVDTPFDRKSPGCQHATQWMYATYPKSTADRQREYDLLSLSNIRWTMVRLPLIDLTDERREIRTSLEDCPGDKISATSLAAFLVAQCDKDTFVGKAPFIADI
jgi:putative NADH-flavin reductase